MCWCTGAYKEYSIWHRAPFKRAHYRGRRDIICTLLAWETAPNTVHESLCLRCCMGNWRLVVSLIQSAVSKLIPPASRSQLGVAFPQYEHVRRGPQLSVSWLDPTGCLVAMHAECCPYCCRRTLALRSLLQYPPLISRFILFTNDVR